LHNCGKIIDAFCRNFTYFTYKCGICKIIVQFCTTVEQLYAPLSTNFNGNLWGKDCETRYSTVDYYTFCWLGINIKTIYLEYRGTP
jgi:hypothetical protein